MKAIVKEGLDIEKFELEPSEAIKLMEEKKEPYKVELINEHAEKASLSVFTSRVNSLSFVRVLTLWI